MSHWIRADETPSAPRFYYFEKEFDAPKGATLKASSCGDTRYVLYLNGHLVSEGPCQGSQYVTYYETEDLTPYLVEGKNKLIAKVLYVTEGWFISVYRLSHPAFWFDGTLTVDGVETSIGTDDSWSCFREDACSFVAGPHCHTSIPPFEVWSGASLPTPVVCKSFYQPDLNRKGFNLFGLNDPYVMSPRPIPKMETEEEKPLKAVRSGEGFIEFDTVKYTTAKVHFSFKAKAGTKVRIIYTECYSVADGHGNRYKGRRDAYDDPTARIDGVFDILTATGEEQTFDTFWYRSFRFARVEFEDPDCEILGFTYANYHYPLDFAGSFVCSNERYNEMWEISRNTVLCCMHEMYVDCPYYEQQQYDMDSALEMLFTMRMGEDLRMPFKSVTDLAHSQIADGMLQANYPSVMIQIIPDFTLFWVLMLRDYLRYAGDAPEELTRVNALMGTVQKAIEAFVPYMNEDGLIGVTPYWHFVDWVPGWHVGVPNGGFDEPITVTSLMFAAACKAAAELCDALGRPGLASDYRARAEIMIENVKKTCYDTEVQLFRNTPNTKEYSQHTTLWAILSGAVTGEEAGALMDRTFDGHVPVAVCSFSMNHYMFRALELSGRYNEYAPKQLKGWETMLDWHCTTWCENPDSPRTECHGWSSAPTYEFSAMVLGVYPTADGYKSVRIKPNVDCFGLDWARGTVPTPYGVITVDWEKEDGHLTLEVTLPKNADMTCEVILPNGDRYMQTDEYTRYVQRI